MEILVEKILIYGIAILLILSVLVIYFLKQHRESKEVEKKIALAKENNLYEPVSLYPVVDLDKCIRSGACIKACPEHDILGIRNGHATIINASQCIGHGACFRACPTEAITLWIGTEKRGVDLPDVTPAFETNIKGIYIAGELGGMGLIRNAVKQGKEAVENIAASISKGHNAQYDLVVVGAGPAGISATLEAKKQGLNVLTIEQDSLGGTVYTYPRSKIIMTHPMDLPLYGKVRFKETSKDELLELWNTVLSKNKITIKERTKVETIKAVNNIFEISTLNGEAFTTKTVLLALGRRGTPRKLNIPGEESQKVAYRLLDSDQIKNKKIIIVGGGDSAVESALLLANNNKVTISYRGEKFSRLKQKNNQLITNAIATDLVEVIFNSNLVSIEKDIVKMNVNNDMNETEIENDQVYIFVGGELPTHFLKKTGIKINTKYGEPVLIHK